MRILETTLDSILYLIYCADDYGFADDVLFEAFADMLNRRLSFEEIEVYASSIASKDGYGKEDYEAIKESLTSFKKAYC